MAAKYVDDFEIVGVKGVCARIFRILADLPNVLLSIVYT